MKPTLLCGAVSLLTTLLLTAQDDIPDPFERGRSTAAATTAGSADHDPFDPAINAPKIVRTQVEWIEVSHKDLTRLMMEDSSTTFVATSLRKTLQAMVEKGTAKIIETQICNARSGEKSISESINEFIYPTEYEFGNQLADDSDTKKTDPPPSAATFLATAFETRNVGSTLELEPTLSPDEGKMIDLRFVPELVYHTGFSTYFDGKDALGNDIKVVMPKIYTARLVSAITCISGQYHLAGILSPKDDDGNADPERKLMLFVKCTTLAVAE